MAKLDTNIEGYKLSKTGKRVDDLLERVNTEFDKKANKTEVYEETQAIENKISQHKKKPALDHPDSSVTRAKIADGSIDGAKIDNYTIEENHIKKNAITLRTLSNNIWSILSKYSTHSLEEYWLSELNSGMPNIDVYILHNDTNDSIDYFRDHDEYGTSFSEAIPSNSSRICIRITKAHGGAEVGDGYIYVLPESDLNNYFESLENNLDYNTIDYVPYDYDPNAERVSGMFSIITKAEIDSDGDEVPYNECPGIAFGTDESGKPSLWFWGDFAFPKKVVEEAELSNYYTKSEVDNVLPTIDAALSATSTNPVQNRILKSALDELQASINQIDTSGFSQGEQSIPTLKLSEMVNTTSTAENYDFDAAGLEMFKFYVIENDTEFDATKFANGNSGWGYNLSYPLYWDELYGGNTRYLCCKVDNGGWVGGFCTDGYIYVFPVNNRIDGTDITANSIGSNAIADGAINTNKVSNYAITTQKIADGAITNDKLGSASVGLDNLDEEVASRLNASVSADTTQIQTQIDTIWDEIDEIEAKPAIPTLSASTELRQGKNGGGYTDEKLELYCPYILYNDTNIVLGKDDLTDYNNNNIHFSLPIPIGESRICYKVRSASSSNVGQINVLPNYWATEGANMLGINNILSRLSALESKVEALQS